MQTKPTVIALGYFDGVHLGHGALLQRVREAAEERGAVPAAFTFDRQPAAAITGTQVPLLTGVEVPLEEALERLAAADVKNVSLTTFDVIAQVAAEENYIRPEDIARLIAFRDDPSDESWIGGGK